MTGFANVSHLLGLVDFWRGGLDDAAAHLESAIDARRYGWERFLPDAAAYMCRVQIERGDLDAAESSVRLCDDDDRWRDTGAWAFVQEARARLALARGDGAEALDRSLAAGDQLAGRMLVRNPAVLPWRSTAALSARLLGDDDRAADLAADELRLARAFGAVRPIGMALRAAGLVAGGETGIALLAEAVAVLDGSPYRTAHAHALADHGAALRRTGRRADARRSLRAAREMAQRIGAGAIESAAEEELAAVGDRPRRAAQPGGVALTPSERRVARMAAKGMTNREIAQALFVTVKAVQWHLGNVYRKLEVQRDGLAAALDDADGR